LQLSAYYALPELILVIGALALLMVCAMVGESSTDFVTGGAIFLLIIVWLLAAEMPSLRRSSCRRAGLCGTSTRRSVPSLVRS
jgi:hypothetical protein